MKSQNKKAYVLVSFSLLLIISCKKNDIIPTPVVKPDLVFYGLSASNQIIRYNTMASQTALATTSITGLPAGEKIIAIDFRPATGQLYGLGSGSRLFVINHETGAATAIGVGPFTPALSGTIAGFDFNPTVDRIRIVTTSGQNLRLHPESGVVAATDMNLNPGIPGIGAVAYTNSFSGASSTTLFDIDFTTGKLYKQDPPNNGVLVEIGNLDITGMVSNEGGFDISPDNTVAIASLMVNGATTLYRIDLTTGKATTLGNFGGSITGIAIPTDPVGYSVDISNNLQIFNPFSTGTPVNKTITGLQAGELIVGIDFRPANGQLYALGNSSRLYTINTSSGAATMIGAGPFTPLLTGTSFGFDFNPTVDRIRVISNTGQNLRLNPNDGTVAATDGILNPGTPSVSASAYTNNFAGTTTTSLFNLDPLTDKLYIQNPPNNGTLVEVGSLGIDINLENGFDITGTSNKGYALVSTGAGTRIYQINLTTGLATQTTVFPNGARGLAIGLGF